jgi:aspartate kinase
MENINYDISLISNIFEAIANKKINVDMISQTSPVRGTVNVSFTVPSEDLNESLVVLDKFTSRDNITIDEDITKFSVVGIGMKTTSGVAAKIFRTFSENNIEVKMITTSEIRITCAIKREDKQRAVSLIAKEFNL